MTKIFLNTLGPFYYERMIASAPSDFTEMVNMGMRLEEGVRQGRLVRETVPTSNVKKFGNNFQRKKEQEVSMVAHGQPQQQYTGYQHVAAVTPTINTTQSPGYQSQFQQRPQQQYQQQYQQSYQQQNRAQRTPQFDPIPMKYAELLPALLEKNLVRTRPPPRVPERLPGWYRADLSCAFHQGAPGHDTEHCYALKFEVQKLVQTNVLSFKDLNPNVQANPLPNHGAASVNMIQECGPEEVEGVVFVIVPEFNIPKQIEVTFNSQKSAASTLVICPPGSVPYISEKAIPYKYSATMIEDGREVPLPSLPAVGNIAEDSRVLRNGRIIPTMAPKKVNASISQQVQVGGPVMDKSIEQPGGANVDSDLDEILKLIKKSEYKMVEQLMQTPSKISILSLLLNSDAHREALMKVLDQAFVDHDVTTGQFGEIVGNITACNNLSFSDEELPEEGRNHNLALHISMNCKSDALSNVLVDTGSSLNVMSKTTLDQLSYRGTPMRRSGVVVKAFDGSRKSVLGEVDLPITIGPHLFQITFQVMDIQAAYSCLLGRPWIHEAGAVTSTLHQKLKFAKNGKLVTVNGEEAVMVSHLSAFSFIGGGDTDGTQFQGLSLDDKNAKKDRASISSLKDVQEVIQSGLPAGWGKVTDLPEYKHKKGLGFFPSIRSVKTSTVNEPIKEVFRSAGFIHAPPEVSAIIEDSYEEMAPRLVTRGAVCRNWVAVDVPSATHVSK
jgi:hypothetical protein